MSQQRANPLVTIPSLGTVQGVLDDTGLVAKFLNVPVGHVPERWRPAVQTKPWQGIKDATKSGLIPPQQTKNRSASTLFSGLPAKNPFENMSEHDCLGCNIYVPASALVSSSDELPVLAFVYGGEFKTGAVGLPIYDCTPLIRTSIELNKPFVMVALSYRTNYFGFLSSKEMVQDAEHYRRAVPESQRTWYDGSVGNWGLLDMIMGLQFIQDHIRAFSGNPRQVTVMGQSSGAVSVSSLHLVPQCHGLFKRSIIQSGPAGLIPAVRPEFEGQMYFDRLCHHFKVPMDLAPLDKVARLRALPAQDIAEYLNTAPIISFRPTLDGVLFKEDTRIIAGDPSSYDPKFEWMMIGSCLDEGTGFNPRLGATNLTAFQLLRRRLSPPDQYALFDQIYGVPKTDAEAITMSTRAIAEGGFDFPALLIQEAIVARLGRRVSRYYFDRHADRIESMAPGLGAFHGIDLFFVFGNDHAKQALSKEERAFSKQVQAVWIEFVTAKSPDTSMLPTIRHPGPQKAMTTTTTTTTTTTHQDVSGKKEKMTTHILQVKSDESIVFGKDLKVGRDVAERLSEDVMLFWRRSEAYAIREARAGRGADCGGELYEPLTPKAMRAAAEAAEAAEAAARTKNEEEQEGLSDKEDKQQRHSGNVGARL
ncbi:hypothetical protein EDD11_001486 [Mortierella claussenii]|nr:hypothetical protein EDD11_001486 [Mortierella claussenii]